MSRHSARSNAYRKAWAALRRAAAAAAMPCAICGRGIDYDLRYPHPWSYSADHALARAHGSSETEGLRPAHLRCNQARGDGRRRVRQRPVLRTSRVW